MRDHIKTPTDFAATLNKLRKIGYEAVQVSALGPMETSEIAKILREEGMTCAATHVSLDMMRDTDACVAYHQALGCKYTALGSFKGAWEGETTTQMFRDFAKEFSPIAKTLAAKGVFVGYHNHAAELTRLDDKRWLDVLIDECDESVWFEIDTYWITAGGGDPAAWIDKVAASGKNRIPCVHLKDMDLVPVQKQRMCEVGSGNLNWPRILDACRKARVQWYLIERDSGALDPFESLKISFENLREMGVK